VKYFTRALTLWSLRTFAEISDKDSDCGAHAKGIDESIDVNAVELELADQGGRAFTPSQVGSRERITRSDPEVTHVLRNGGKQAVSGTRPVRTALREGWAR
jgi:hypothetical protein